MGLRPKSVVSQYIGGVSSRIDGVGRCCQRIDKSSLGDSRRGNESIVGLQIRGFGNGCSGEWLVSRSNRNFSVRRVNLLIFHLLFCISLEKITVPGQVSALITFEAVVRNVLECNGLPDCNVVPESQTDTLRDLTRGIP